MGSSILVSVTLLLVHQSCQTQVAVIPLYTIASGCSGSSGLCREAEDTKNNWQAEDTKNNCSSNTTSFELHETACILEPRFSSGVNQVNITTDHNISHYSISVDSFYNDSAQDRLVVFKRSTAMPFMFEVNVTDYHGSGRKTNINIAYYYNDDVSTTASSTSSSEGSSSYSSVDSQTTTSSADTTTIIIAIVVVGVVLGLLLLLVACAVFALTFAVLSKRKKRSQSPMRIHSTQPNNNAANMYEASFNSLGEGFKKVDRGNHSMDMHRPPKDPEYATLSEWKHMAENENMNNPLYSSSISLNARKGAAAVQVPQLEWSGSAWDALAPPSQMTPNSNHSDPSVPPPQLARVNTFNQTTHAKSSSLKCYAGDSLSSPKQSSFIYRESLPDDTSGEATPPPLPSSNPPSVSLSKFRPSLPPKHSKRKLVPSGGAVSSNKLVVRQMKINPPGTIDGVVSAGKSPLVQNNHRAVGKTQSNEIINNEYAVAGMKLKNLEN